MKQGTKKEACVKFEKHNWHEVKKTKDMFNIKNNVLKKMTLKHAILNVVLH